MPFEGQIFALAGFANSRVVGNACAMTRTQLSGKKNAPATARAVNRGKVAVRKSGGRKRAAVPAANDDEPLPFKGIGEIAAAIVERLAAQKRDA